MECKFLTNGIAIQYHDFLKPCCTWRYDDAWVQNHNVNKIDIVKWHDHPDLVSARAQLAQGHWPKNCVDCQTVEEQGRQDSIRLNGASAYGDYKDTDITLEFRPGSVCNFACQTCWTPASTRVADYYKKAGVPDPFAGLIKNSFDDFDLILPIADRLRSIVVLGGEPFYDPKCREFLQWCQQHTPADLVAFTNGSCVDAEFVKNFPNKFTLVFSLDAVGKAAEYIRFGTDWPKVVENYNLVKSLPNVEVRVNITTSPYNFYYFIDVVDMLLDDWPSVVSFGPAIEEHLNERVIPLAVRRPIIDKLIKFLPRLESADIEKDQKANAVNAVKAIINNLETMEYDPRVHAVFKDFVSKMDMVKKVRLQDHCPEIAGILE
jgi:sulfatase maturation enzyme AslB (radical SAM superfamily)